jgi:hypothetical protein
LQRYTPALDAITAEDVNAKLSQAKVALGALEGGAAAAEAARYGRRNGGLIAAREALFAAPPLPHRIPDAVNPFEGLAVPGFGGVHSYGQTVSGDGGGVDGAQSSAAAAARASAAGLYKLNAVDPQLNTACFQPLNLSHDKPVSKLLPNGNTCTAYTAAEREAAAAEGRNDGGGALGEAGRAAAAAVGAAARRAANAEVEAVGLYKLYSVDP